MPLYKTNNFEIEYSDFGGHRVLHPILEMYLISLYDDFKTLFVNNVMEKEIFEIKNMNKINFSKDLLSYSPYT